MNKQTPYRVTVPDGKVRLVIMNATDGLPAAFALMGTRAKHKVAVRILGGCKGMNAADKEEMLAFFAEAFAGFAGLVWSGGTRQTDAAGEIDPMVTDVPAIIAQNNPGAVALGTIPRIELLTLQEDSRLVLDQYGTVPNPEMSGLLIVQNGADAPGDWDGDVATYLNLMDQWGTHAGFTALGTVAWNGGAITEKEIFASASRGWPTILVTGSGRVTDEIAGKLLAGNNALLEKLGKNHDKVKLVAKDNPEALREILSAHGFFEPVAAMTA